MIQQYSADKIICLNLLLLVVLPTGDILLILHKHR